MAEIYRSTISPISVVLPEALKPVENKAARAARACADPLVEALTAGQSRRLLILLLSGSSWESIAKALDVPVERLHLAGTTMATEMFRGER